MKEESNGHRSRAEHKRRPQHKHQVPVRPFPPQHMDRPGKGQSSRSLESENCFTLFTSSPWLLPPLPPQRKEFLSSSPYHPPLQGHPEKAEQAVSRLASCWSNSARSCLWATLLISHVHRPDTLSWTQADFATPPSL